MKVLPSPGVLRTRISPPSRRAISRLIDSPRPVPPYMRPVPVSACWNGSKMIFSLSAAMPMPVSLTEKATTRPARLSTGWSTDQPSAASSIRRSTRPVSVNLQAFESRFRSTCWSRLASVEMAAGRPAASVDPERQALGLGHRAERALDVFPQLAERVLADLDRHRPRLDLGHVEDVVDQREQVGARRVDRLGELLLLGRQVPVGVVREHLGEDQQAVERGPQLVRHVGEELGLVLRGQLELLGLLLEGQLGQLDLAVLALDLRSSAS